MNKNTYKYYILLLLFYFTNMSKTARRRKDKYLFIYLCVPISILFGNDSFNCYGN